MRYSKVCEQVYETAREIYEAKLVTGTWGNVSARIDDCIVITPSGMDYRAIEPEDMIILDFQGNVVKGKYRPSVETPLHLQLYTNRSDIKAIVHVHSPFATAFAVARQPIPVILEETAQVIGHEIPVAPYAHCGTDELAQRVVSAMKKDKKAALLANHGLIAGDITPAAALKVCYIAEKTAMITIYARQLGAVNNLTEDDIKYLNESFKSYGQSKE